MGQQLADLLRDSETYVTRTVDFLNGHVGTNIDAASVIGAINDPNGSVQQFIDRVGPTDGRDLITGETGTGNAVVSDGFGGTATAWRPPPGCSTSWGPVS